MPVGAGRAYKARQCSRLECLKIPGACKRESIVIVGSLARSTYISAVSDNVQRVRLLRTDTPHSGEIKSFATMETFNEVKRIQVLEGNRVGTPRPQRAGQGSTARSTRQPTVSGNLRAAECHQSNCQTMYTVKFSTARRPVQRISRHTGNKSPEM